MMASRFALEAVPDFSLWELAEREARNHKWLLSERSGYDVGRDGLCDWSRRYWRVFCRYRWIDHLLGRRRIREFDDRSFGRLCDPRIGTHPTMRFVVKHFAEDGWENLKFLLEAEEHGVSLPELREALTLVDVNSVRFDPPWV